MTAPRLAFLALAAALFASADAVAGPDAAAGLVAKESAARVKAADELAAFARFAVSYSAKEEARQAYAKAIAFDPREALKTELAKLKDAKGSPQKGALAQIADRRAKTLAKCADLLAPVAAGYAAADRGDDLARLVALMRAQALPVDAPLAKLDVVFFEPYLDFRRKKDVEKLVAGWETVDGRWLDPAKVADRNAAHATWSDPWVVADDVHEVRTTLPLRTARQVLAHVAAFRRFFLDSFAGEWDLKTPNVKLPVIVSGTRADMEARMHELAAGAGAAPPQAAAFYLAGNGDGNPCFVSFEVRGADGGTTKVDFAGLRWSLTHEVGHQIAFEFSKHAADRTRLTNGLAWAVEGLAEFLPSYALVDGAWVMKRPRAIPMGDGYFETGPAWCHEHVDRIPPLEEFVTLDHRRFDSVEKYHVAATLAWFLLEGRDRAYRPGFVKLLETVHQCKERDDTFATCLPGVALPMLDAEFRAFCRAIQLDPK